MRTIQLYCIVFVNRVGKGRERGREREILSDRWMDGRRAEFYEGPCTFTRMSGKSIHGRFGSLLLCPLLFVCRLSSAVIPFVC